MLRRLSSALAALLFSMTAALALSDGQIPTKTPTPWANSAGGSFVNTIPVASQIGITNCRASFTDGFPPLTFTPSSAGGCPPFGADFNGILQLITQWLRWDQAGGPVQYDSAFSSSVGGYPKGATLAATGTAGCTWMSTVDNNASNPDAGGANWVALCATNSSGGTSTGSANAQVVTVPPFLLQVGSTVTYVAGFTNTAALQINVNGGGLINVFVMTPSGPVITAGNEIGLGSVVEVLWDGSRWQCASCGIVYTGTAGQIPINQGGEQNALKTMSGDCTLAAAGSIACSTLNGIPVSFAGGRVVAAPASSCAVVPAIQFTNIQSVSTLCYIAYANNGVTINGVNHTFSSPLTIPLTSNILASNLYDVYLIFTGGNVVGCVDRNPWTTTTIRADLISQGTNGLYSNAGTIANCDNGGTDYTALGAGSALYIGTFWATGSGITQWTPTPTPAIGGPTNTNGTMVGIFNAYNQITTTAFMGDLKLNYTFSGTNQWQNFGSSLAERISYVDGLGLSQAQFYFKSDWTGHASGINGGGTSLCVDGVGNSPAAPTCTGGGPGTDFAQSATSWSTDSQVGMTGLDTTTMIAISEHWLVAQGFHFVQALWVTQAGQTVNISSGNHGCCIQMRARIPM
jgi:hypothetical protein